jgi:hypothetical protein
MRTCIRTEGFSTGTDKVKYPHRRTKDPHDSGRVTDVETGKIYLKDAANLQRNTTVPFPSCPHLFSYGEMNHSLYHT